MGAEPAKRNNGLALAHLGTHLLPPPKLEGCSLSKRVGEETVVAHPRCPLGGLGKGRRFATSSPGRRTRSPRAAPPPRGAQRSPAATFRTRAGRPHQKPRARGAAFGGGARGHSARGGPGGPGPGAARLRTWERRGPRGAGGELALGPWRRGRPGLAQRRRLQEARGFGLRRRRRVPRPLRRPRSVRETAALRPAPSAAQAPAAAPTSTWGPIETVRHAPPASPEPRRRAALRWGGGGGRTRGGATGRALTRASWNGRRPALLGPPRRGRSGRQLQPPPPERPPSPLADSPLKPATPPPALRGPGGSQRPPAARRPPARPPRPLRSRPNCSRGPAGPAAGGVWDPTVLPAAGPGAGTGSLTPGGPCLRRGSPKSSARLTVEAGKIKTRGEGRGPAPGLADAHLGGRAGVRLARGLLRGPPPAARPGGTAFGGSSATHFFRGGGGSRKSRDKAPLLFNSLQPFNSRSHLLGPRFSLFFFYLPFWKF